MARRTYSGYFPPAKRDGSLPEGWEGGEGPDEYGEWEALHDFDRLLEDLPGRQREVLRLAHREGLSPAQIAERLGVTRNAVDQAIHRGHRRLAEKMHA